MIGLHTYLPPYAPRAPGAKAFAPAGTSAYIVNDQRKRGSMNSRRLKAFNIHVVGALPSRCPIASIIAFKIHTKGLSKTPSLDELGRIFRSWAKNRHTSPLGDHLCIGDWVVTCTPRLCTVWSHEAFVSSRSHPSRPPKLAA